MRRLPADNALVPFNSPPPLRRKREKGLEVCHYQYVTATGAPLVGANGAPLVDAKGSPLKGAGRVFRFAAEGDAGEAVLNYDLFPIGVLATLLGRTYRCIYKWEKDYGFPQALFHVEDDKQKKRWYSRAQLAATRKLYEHYGCLAGKKNAKKLKDFIASVNAVWYKLDRQPKKVSV